MRRNRLDEYRCTGDEKSAGGRVRDVIRVHIDDDIQTPGFFTTVGDFAKSATQ